MLSLFFRNLFFTILQPGIVAGIVPFWILGNRFGIAFTPSLQFYQYPAILLFVAGVFILFDCIIRFAVEGRGTLSPADPTKKLVIIGLYRFSRNPMYIGVTMIITGEALFFYSFNIFIYLLLVFSAFNLFIILFEEPRLRKDFNADYSEYFKNVRRWI